MGSYVLWKLRAFLNKITSTACGKHTLFHVLTALVCCSFKLETRSEDASALVLAHGNPYAGGRRKLCGEGRTKHLQTLGYSYIHQLRHSLRDLFIVIPWAFQLDA